MEDQIVKAVKMLFECKGMEDCPWRLIRTPCDGFKVETEPYCTKHKNGSVTMIGFGPWLKIEDGNPWSSAAILARAGYQVTRVRGQWLLSPLEADGPKGSHVANNLAPYEQCPKDMQETANILGIVKLYEIDRKAYDKGMELIISGA